MSLQHEQTKALIVQSDGSLLVDLHASNHESTRAKIGAFAHIVKTPDHLHTYKITPISLWNAAAAGWTPERVKQTLCEHARYEPPEAVLCDIEEKMRRYGQLVLEELSGSTLHLRLIARNPELIETIEKYESLRAILEVSSAAGEWIIAKNNRGVLKQFLSKIGFPVIDCAGYTDGAPIEISLRDKTKNEEPFSLRYYQQQAVDAFLHPFWATNGRNSLVHTGAGHGVVVLPCGAGKTMVGIGVMTKLKMHTLILATGTTAVRQWIAEILDKTNIGEKDIGEYSGQLKQIRPITVATYQIATRARHRSLLESYDFGLIIYDEVHLLPAPLFRTTANLQARRRLGMTATLVREDGKESEVFTLIGPKRYEQGWRSLEEEGWVARAICKEIRVPAPQSLVHRLEKAKKQDAYRLAAENPHKERVVESLLGFHRGQRILIIGQYLSQLRRLAKRLNVPLLTGEVEQEERDLLFEDFRAARRPVIVVSRVANFSVDLPDASVCIQISGLFGSRQEEAQRLGRILRPKNDGRNALFYTLVTPDTSEQKFALARQRFLTQQGYRYSLSTWNTNAPEQAFVIQEKRPSPVENTAPSTQGQRSLEINLPP